MRSFKFGANGGIFIDLTVGAPNFVKFHKVVVNKGLKNLLDRLRDL